MTIGEKDVIIAQRIELAKEYKDSPHGGRQAKDILKNIRRIDRVLELYYIQRNRL